MRGWLGTCAVLVAAVLAVGPAAGQAPAEAPSSVALWPLKSLGVEAETTARVESVLGEALAELEGIELQGVEAIARVRDADPALAHCTGTPECIAAAGRAAGAARVVVGVLSSLGDTYSLDLRLVDVGRAERVRRVAQTWSAEEAALLQVMRSAAVRVLMPEAYLGRVVVRTNVSGVKVFLDGDFAGRTPLKGPLTVTPGRHVLRMQSPDHQPFEEFVDVPFDAEVPVDVELAPLAVEAVVDARAPAGPFAFGARGGLVAAFGGAVVPRFAGSVGYVLPWWGERTELALEVGFHRMAGTPTVLYPGGSESGASTRTTVMPMTLQVAWRPYPHYPFRPVVHLGGGVHAVWQMFDPGGGYATQTFRDLQPGFHLGTGVELRAGPGDLVFDLRYEHLDLGRGGGAGGATGLASGIVTTFGYRFRPRGLR